MEEESISSSLAEKLVILFQKELVDFNGRIDRTVYFILDVIYLLILLLWCISYFLLSSLYPLFFSSMPEVLTLLLTLIKVVSVIVSLGVFVSFLSSTVRRIHDFNKSGWYALILFIPVVDIFFFFFLLLKKGTLDTNNYGPRQTLDAICAEGKRNAASASTEADKKAETDSESTEGEAETETPEGKENGEVNSEVASENMEGEAETETPVEKENREVNSEVASENMEGKVELVVVVSDDKGKTVENLGAVSQGMEKQSETEEVSSDDNVEELESADAEQTEIATSPAEPIENKTNTENIPGTEIVNNKPVLPVQKEKQMDVFTLADNVSLTGRMITKFIYKNIEYPASDWVDMFAKVIRLLHEENKAILPPLVYADTDSSDLAAYFSYTLQKLRKGLEIVPGLYVESDLSTDLKFFVLKRLFKMFGIEQENLIFCLQNNGIATVAKPEDIQLEYWTYALTRIKEANKGNGLFSNAHPHKKNWISASFGIDGVNIGCVATKKQIRTEIVFSKADKETNKVFFDSLFLYKDHIEKKLGVALIWDRGNNRKSSKVYYQDETLKVDDKTDWDKITEFYAKWSKEFYDVIVPFVRYFDKNK